MAKKFRELYRIEIDGIERNLNLTIEPRKNCRASIGKTGLNVRISSYLSGKERRKYLDDAIAWAGEQYKTLPEDHFQTQPKFRIYIHDQDFTVGKKTFKIHISPISTQTSKGQIHENTLYLRISTVLDEEERKETISNLVARLVASSYYSEIYNRLRNFNDKHIGKTIKSLKFRDNKSKWGSCSSSGAISISTRLLFAPDEVVDYVLVHELAHLVHLNHSQDFWQLVESIMPDYRKHEEFLKKMSSEYYF